MKLSVLMPVYNEVETIEEIVRRVMAVDVEKELIIVDDGSADGTRAILERMDMPDVRVVMHEHNMGKGAAVQTALQHATGEVVVIQDADFEYDPQDYHKLLAPYLRGETEIVYGARTLHSQSALRKLGNQFLTLATNILYGCALKDMETCYKLIKTDIMRSFPLHSRRFDIEPEITAKLLKRGHRIVEVPISYDPRVDRKLVPLRDGWPALWALLKYRFVD